MFWLVSLVSKVQCSATKEGEEEMHALGDGGARKNKRHQKEFRTNLTSMLKKKKIPYMLFGLFLSHSTKPLRMLSLSPLANHATLTFDSTRAVISLKKM